MLCHVVTLLVVAARALTRKTYASKNGCPTRNEKISFAPRKQRKHFAKQHPFHYIRFSVQVRRRWQTCSHEIHPLARPADQKKVEKLYISKRTRACHAFFAKDSNTWNARARVTFSPSFLPLCLIWNRRRWKKISVKSLSCSKTIRSAIKVLHDFLFVEFCFSSSTLCMSAATMTR